MKLKVLHVTLSMGTGGLERSILNLLNAYDKSLFDPAVLCLDAPGDLFSHLKELGIPGYCEHRKPGLDLGLIFRLFSFLKKHPMDVIHTHNQAALFYAGPAAFMARVPVRIITEHSRHRIDGVPIRMWEKRFLSYLVNHWVTVSQSLLDQGHGKDGIHRDKLRVIPNGIRVSPTLPEKKRKKDIKKRLGVGADDFVIFMPARLDPVKNHVLVLETLAQWKDEWPHVHCVLAGDGPHKKHLEQHSQSLGIGEFIHFLGNRDDVEDLWEAADLFVLCSHSEGLSLALLEASASGTPVVVTPASNAAGFIVHGENGWVIESTVDALGRTVAAIISGKENLQAMVMDGYHRVKTNHSSETMTRQYEELYLNSSERKA